MAFILKMGMYYSGFRALLRFSSSLNSVMRLMSSKGMGSDKGNCTDPLAFLYCLISSANAEIPEGPG
jgi:hypothetical protein